jgi:4-hydroxyphenylpyruvate dioxygenase-like putative hemolysin
MAFRVRNAPRAHARALELGAQPVELPTGPMELRLPAIKGIGGAPLYLIDRFDSPQPSRLRAAVRRPTATASRSTTSTSSSSTVWIVIRAAPG